MRILFVTATRIGDAVLSTGLLSHLIERYPERPADDRRRPGRGAAVRGRARARAADRRREAALVVALAGALRAHVAGRRWDIVVDLRGSALAWLLRAGERWVMARAIAREHRVRQLGRLFDLDPPPSPRLWTAPAHERAAEALVPPGSPVLAIGPAANWRGKQWRAERFAELARRLTAPRRAAAAAARVAVLAAAHERAQAEPLLAALPAAAASSISSAGPIC